MSVTNENVPVVLITGAARGIGLAAARRFGGEGAKVLLVDRDKQALDTAMQTIGEGTYHGHVLDITNPEAPQQLMELAADTVGPVSVLVNNAGVSPKRNGQSSGLLEIDQSEWDVVMGVNLYATFRLCKACIPGMQKRKWGRIINISSLAGRTKSIVAGATYMASKAAVLGLTRSIAMEFGPAGITANSVAPGRVDTVMANQGPANLNSEYAAQIPVRRLGTPDEVAAAITFLASSEAGFINGAVIDVNGGFFMP